MPPAAATGQEHYKQSGLASQKFTPKLNRAQSGTDIKKDTIIAAQDTSMRPPENRNVIEKTEVNLLSQALISGPQKFINRNEALARAGGAPQTALPDKKTG